MSDNARDYRPALSMAELIAEIRGILQEQRAAERLLCRYLADLSDRVDLASTEEGRGVPLRDLVHRNGNPSARAAWSRSTSGAG